MCILVLSNFCDALDQTAASEVSCEIGLLIDRARVDRRAVAFIQRKDGSSFGRLGVRIGRYEPIFTLCETDGNLPYGLTEFIVRHAGASIELAGFAARDQFEGLSQTLQRSGYSTSIAPETSFMVSDEILCTQPSCRCQDQWSGYDPLNCAELSCLASRKNHSTFWPRA